jgi:hypothetical protein
VGSLLVLVGGCAAGTTTGSQTNATAPTTGGAEATPAPTEPCTLAGGDVELAVPRPEGFAVGRSDQACVVAEEAKELPLFVTISAVKAGSSDTNDAGDAGRARHLDEGPSGAVRWAKESGLFGESVRPIGERTVQVSGQTVRYPRLLGKPRGFGVRREVAVVVVPHGNYHLVVLAIYAPGNPAAHRRALELVAAVEPQPNAPR